MRTKPERKNHVYQFSKLVYIKFWILADASHEVISARPSYFAQADYDVHLLTHSILLFSHFTI